MPSSGLRRELMVRYLMMFAFRNSMRSIIMHILPSRIRVTTGSPHQGPGQQQDLPALRPPDRPPRPAVQEEGTGARERGSGRPAQERHGDHVQVPGRGEGQCICGGGKQWWCWKSGSSPTDSAVARLWRIYFGSGEGD